MQKERGQRLLGIELRVREMTEFKAERNRLKQEDCKRRIELLKL
jgi:hypothetical protein